MRKQIQVLSGTSNRPLAEAICGQLKIPLGNVEHRRFSDGEAFVRINENIRGADVFIVQSTNQPDANLIELLLMLDAARRASADRITAVIPYFGYARQDRKDQPRVALTAKLIANLIVAAGATRVLTMDLHADQIQGFFDIPVDHLYAGPIMVNHFLGMGIEKPMVVSPDLGGVKMARWFAQKLGESVEMAVIDKRRPKPNDVEIMNIIGDVRGRTCIIVDDMIDTATTTVRGAAALLEGGAKDVYASCTHAVFSGNAEDCLKASDIRCSLVTDTIHHTVDGERIRNLTVAPLIADAINRIHESESISILFR
ncbi:MAG: ribose-phosphate pyrophosphokinase [Gemmatimonadetes bacterium]|nr:ribose-phosphate pyrophosphokinase [Gemmatimonadota bacterium]